MVEVLAKAEKYINGEEALLSKRENSVGARKSENEAPRDEEAGIDPYEGTKGIESGL